jgi:hypothetical protein
MSTELKLLTTDDRETLRHLMDLKRVGARNLAETVNAHLKIDGRGYSGVSKNIIAGMLHHKKDFPLTGWLFLLATLRELPDAQPRREIPQAQFEAYRALNLSAGHFCQLTIKYEKEHGLAGICEYAASIHGIHSRASTSVAVPVWERFKAVYDYIETLSPEEIEAAKVIKPTKARPSHSSSAQAGAH